MKLLNVACLTLFFVTFESSHQTTRAKISSAEKAFTVTLVVFSGVPDPTWLITSTTELFHEIENAINLNQGLDPSQMPETLGYRGFLVRADDDNKEYLILGKSTIKLQKKLLNSVPPGLISLELKSNLAKTIPTVKPLTITHSHAITKRKATIYNGATRSFWNKRFFRNKNNCYNYATDKPTNTFAKPGRGTGQQFAVMQGVAVRDAARRDGLILYNYNNPAPPPIPSHPTRHLVALFVYPANDFHWYRLDSNNSWSHKPGRNRVTNRDNNNLRIVDPRIANTGTYVFVAFMFVDEKSATIW